MEALDELLKLKTLLRLDLEGCEVAKEADTYREKVFKVQG